MRLIVLSLLLLASQAVYSQQISINKGNLRAANPFNLAVKLNKANTKVIADEDRYLPQEVLSDKKPFLSSTRPLGPNDFFMNGFASPSVSFDQMMLGRTMTQSIDFLGIKSNVRYVFDYNNNLVDHQWSFTINKKKKKK